MGIDHNTSMSYWLDRWASQRPRDLSPAQRKAGDTRIERYIRPHFGRRSVTRITSDQVVDWIEELQDEGVGPDTAYKSLVVLRQVIDLAHDRGGRTDAENPARNVGVPKATFREPEDHEILTDAEIEALADGVGPDYRALILLAACSGARWDELIGLRVDDIELAHRRAYLGATRIVERAGVLTQYDDGERRSVQLDDETAAELKDYIKRTRSWRKGRWNWLFLTNRDHKHPFRSNFTIHSWRPALDEAGLADRGITFNSLRHTAAVNMILRGESLEDIARYLGHERLLTTRMTYKRWLVARGDFKASDPDVI